MSESKKVMTPEEFRKKMEEISKSNDAEYSHGEADNLMCELLISLGYKDGINIFENMERYYA